LNQIVLNLLGNAIKFTEKGSVNFDLNKVSDENEICKLTMLVSDTGIGISEEKHIKIFDSFSQARSDTSRKFGGTGLGLSIVKKLVALHKGTISVKSELGVGTAFTLIMDYKSTSIETNIANASDNKSDDVNISGDMRILIVEDNKANQTLAVDTILMFNNRIKIDVADNGKIGLDKLNVQDYNLIIMDVQMPVMNGYDTTSYIRNEMEGSKSKTPILGMSAHAMNREKERCLALGMNDYITKPFNPNVLYNKILKLTNYGQEKVEEEEELIPETLLVKDKYKYINLVFLTKTYKGNFDKVKSILNIYIKNIPGQIDDFYTDYESRSLKKIKASAHSLKTTFKYLGVEHMHQLFKTIELEAGAGGISDQIDSQVYKIKEDWLKSKAEIEDFINKGVK